ncbi:MAG: hypothetical protein CO098_06665, partial [Bacteroidetes bacterium CG_4_9_14_3_um_filter_41_19]
WFRAIAYTTTLIDLLSSCLQHSTILLPWLIPGVHMLCGGLQKKNLFYHTDLYLKLKYSFLPAGRQVHNVTRHKV